MPAVERFAREVASHSMDWAGASSLEDSVSEELSTMFIGVVVSSRSAIFEVVDVFAVVKKASRRCVYEVIKEGTDPMA